MSNDMNDKFYENLQEEYIAALVVEVVNKLNNNTLDLTNYTEDSLELINFILEIISDYYRVIVTR